jgi:hypothetical protein
VVEPAAGWFHVDGLAPRSTEIDPLKVERVNSSVGVRYSAPYLYAPRKAFTWTLLLSWPCYIDMGMLLSIVS